MARIGRRSVVGDHHQRSGFLGGVAWLAQRFQIQQFEAEARGTAQRLDVVHMGCSAEADEADAASSAFPPGVVERLRSDAVAPDAAVIEGHAALRCRKMAGRGRLHKGGLDE